MRELPPRDVHGQETRYWFDARGLRGVTEQAAQDAAFSSHC